MRKRIRTWLAVAALSVASLWSVAPPSEHDVQSAGTLSVVSAEPDLCGLSTLWATPPSDPFTPCCAVHDVEYLLPNPRPRLAVDLSFYGCCVDAAGSDFGERARALLFYRIVRVAGYFFYEGPR